MIVDVTHYMKLNQRDCKECGKILKGRLDKKFCDDYCRNAYNNKLNSEQNNCIRNINNILRKNRRLLSAGIDPGTIKSKCSRKALADSGFQFQYYTHQFINGKGQSYFFCYEYGYLALDEEWLLIIKREERDAAPRSFSII